MKPFLKWAGSKYKVIDKIINALPKGQRLVEPFSGSGAVFLNTQYEQYLIADANVDLINLYRCLQQYGYEFINYTNGLFVAENNQELQYYQLREEFNNTNDVFRKSALFVYLNRHCFNGLCRYNTKGGFNVPFGRYKSPLLPQKEMIGFWHKSQSVVFQVADFKQTLAQVKEGDVVYCDPPYAPLTDTANFSSYTQDGFDLAQQQRLAEFAQTLKQQGIPVIISNHNTDFTRSIYVQADITTFDVQRFIAANAANRQKVSELLAVF